MAGNMYRRNFLLGAGAFGAAVGEPLLAGSGTAKVETGGSGVYNAREFGAAGDGKHYDTRAINAAIDACAGQGGGTVLLPAGRYLTGVLRLRSNVNLHLDPGATLLGSEDPSDYPVYSSPWRDGTRMISSLIYGEDLENVSLTGRGTVDGQGRAWWIRQWLRSPKKHVQVPLLSESRRREEVEKIRFGRPRLVRLVRCRNVLIQGLTFMNSPEWTLNPTFCEYVVIDGVTILNPVPSPNTDGIDPESCRNLHISNTHIDVGDDCIAIKSGKDEAGRRMGKPCENVTITNLTTIHGHGGVSIGSEMSGGVRNVAISNCAFQSTQRGIRVKTQRGRGGVVERVVASNITMQDVPEPFGISMFYSRGDVNSSQPVTDATPRFRDFQFDNIVATGARLAGQITGLMEMPVSSVALSNVRLDARRGFSCRNVREIAFREVRIESVEGPALEARNVQDLGIDGFQSASAHDGTPVIGLDQVEGAFLRGCRASRGTSVFLRVAGDKSSDIVLRATDLSQAKERVQLAQGLKSEILSEK
ncbi:MAG: glycoside hydrolase family 28 protein [Acidobacteriota bacterium]